MQINISWPVNIMSKVVFNINFCLLKILESQFYGSSVISIFSQNLKQMTLLQSSKT